MLTLKESLYMVFKIFVTIVFTYCLCETLSGHHYHNPSTHRLSHQHSFTRHIPFQQPLYQLMNLLGSPHHQFRLENIDGELQMR